MAIIAKADLYQSIREDELNQIVRQDHRLINMAISAALSEIKVYLYDSYDVDSIFSQTGDDRHQTLVRHAVDITIWFIVARTQAGIALDDRKARYDRACKWLKMVRDSETYADLPRRATTKQVHIKYGVGTKRNNYY
jgi:phage gp36-like protein